MAQAARNCAASAGRAAHAPRARPAHAWTRLSDEALLSLRFCDLKLSVEGSRLRHRVKRLYAELESRGISVRPHVWLSEEWFSPDGVPGIAVPFYLAHPRLERLERRIMREVEGGNGRQLMRILRHEAGHAVDNAYRLRRRKRWHSLHHRPGQPEGRYGVTTAFWDHVFRSTGEGRRHRS